MDYRAEYQKKLTAAADAVKVVKSGDWVDYGFCANHPVALDKALADRMSADAGLTAIPRCRAITGKASVTWMWP